MDPAAVGHAQGAALRRERDFRAKRFPAAARKIQPRRNPNPKVMGMVMIWTKMGNVTDSVMRKAPLLGSFTMEGDGLSYGKGRGRSPVPPCASPGEGVQYAFARGALSDSLAGA